MIEAFASRLSEWLGVGWAGTAEVFAVVLATLLLHLVARVLLSRLHRRLEATVNPWDDALIGAARRPLTTLIWLLGLSYAAEIAARRGGSELLAFVGPARELAVLGILAWFLVSFIRDGEGNLLAARELAGRPLDPTSVDALAKLLRAAVIITLALVGLQTLGYSISGLLAFGGVGGIIAGLAARDMLANLFGGLTIYLDRPFVVGDWVRSPDRDIEGVVEEIGWRRTAIRSFDKRPLYVPNASFSNIVVVNPSRMSRRRIYETIGVRYADLDRLSDLLGAIRRLLREHPEIDGDEIQMVNFDRFGESALELFVYCFTHTTQWARYHEVKEEVLLAIADLIRGHGAEVAFPTRTVHLAGEVLPDVSRNAGGEEP